MSKTLRTLISLPYIYTESQSYLKPQKYKSMPRKVLQTKLYRSGMALRTYFLADYLKVYKTDKNILKIFIVLLHTLVLSGTFTWIAAGHTPMGIASKVFKFVNLSGFEFMVYF